MKIFSRGQLNPGDDCAAVQRRFSLEDDLRLIVLMNGDGASVRIHHPNETHTPSESFATRLQLIRV